MRVRNRYGAASRPLAVSGRRVVVALSRRARHGACTRPRDAQLRGKKGFAEGQRARAFLVASPSRGLFGPTGRRRVAHAREYHGQLALDHLLSLQAAGSTERGGQARCAWSQVEPCASRRQAGRTSAVTRSCSSGLSDCGSVCTAASRRDASGGVEAPCSGGGAAMRSSLPQVRAALQRCATAAAAGMATAIGSAAVLCCVRRKRCANANYAAICSRNKSTTVSCEL